MKKVLEPIIQRIMYAAIVTLSLAFVVSGQQQDRVVDWQPVPIKSEAKVLELVDIKVAGESITIGSLRKRPRIVRAEGVVQRSPAAQ
jgi:hypothetical protein